MTFRASDFIDARIAREALASARLDGETQSMLCGRGRRRFPGEMNSTERRFYDYLEQQKRLDRVLWFAFEGITFRLADRTTYTPDFVVMLNDMSIVCYDVKGATKSKRTGKKTAFIEDDASVKIKVAAEMFPLSFSLVWPDASHETGWGRKDYGMTSPI